MYPYTPYFDPKMEKTAYLRHVNADYIREKTEENMENTEETAKTPVEQYRRKIDENLKILNMKTTNVIQDGLTGVENICNKVRECLKDDEQRCAICAENYMDKCGRGDIMNHEEENKFRPTANYRTPEVLCSSCPKSPTADKSKEDSTNNQIIAARRTEKYNSENASAPVKSRKSGYRPIFTSSATEESSTARQRRELTSISFDETPKTSETARRCEKRKHPTTRTKKIDSCEEPQAPGNTDKAKPETRLTKNTAGGVCPKERLGEIEKDYEKVVKSLEMVEHMMASISRKMSNSEKTPQEKTVTEEKLPTPKCSTAEIHLIETEKKELPQITESKTKTKPKDKPHRQNQIVDKHWVNEMMKRKKARQLEEGNCVEGMTQSVEAKQKTEDGNIDCNLKPKTSQEFTNLNEPTKIGARESLSDLDALIDNAVHQLGNLVSDFDISQNSSDASFRLTTVDDAKNLYQEYLQDSSSSNFSESVQGEDCPKFEISKSFQQLKESFLRENRPQIRNMALKKKGNLRVKENKDSSRIRIERTSSTEEKMGKIVDSHDHSGQIDFVDSTAGQNGSDKNISDRYKHESQEVEEQMNVDEKETKHKVTESRINSPIPKCQVKEKEDDIITISMPYDKKFRSCTKCKKAVPKIQNINTEQLDDDTIQITVTLKGDVQDRKENKSYDEQNDKKQRTEDDPFSETEFCECIEEFEWTGNDETISNEQYQVKKIEENATQEFNYAQSRKVSDNTRREQNQKSPEAEGESSPPSSENATVSGPRTIYKLAESIQKTKKSFGTDNDLTSSGSASSSQLWSEEATKTDNTPIDPTRPISLQCKKMMSDLVVEEEEICMKKMMKGFFNSALIHSTVGRYKRGRLHPIVKDPDLKDIKPIVHRKMAVSDLHDRMEFQIQQTDSFHGFLNLMDKNRRKALIRHAERQDHNYRCQMKACFRKKYPFKVVTASVPANYETRTKDKKDHENKYFNSLWFSPKDFKLRRNSKIFNEKRLEIYCESLHKDPPLPKCKGREEVSREKRASNYSILVRSGTPLVRKPNTPTRWAHAHSLRSSGNPQRERLRHCDILDDLTMKDLAPFNAEYSNLNEITESQRLEDSLFFKLANGENTGDAEEALMQLISPKLSCTEMESKVCKQKPKSLKKNQKKQKPVKKSGNELTSAKNDDLQTLSPKAAAQLLIQNIGEIKSKKSSPKSKTSEKCLTTQKEVRSKRSMKSIGKNSRKSLTQESKSTIYHKIEENLVKNILCNQHLPMIRFAQTSISPASSDKPNHSFRRVEAAFHTVLKIPELDHKEAWGSSTVTKLFPYINDPENKVFQNITVLPVKILYENETLNDTTKCKIEHLCGDSIADDSPYLSKTDQAETASVDQQKYSAVNDSTTLRKKDNKRRHGIPRSLKQSPSQDYKKNAASPTRLVGLSSPENEIPQAIETPCTPYSKDDDSITQQSTKISTPKTKTRRSNSLGKSTESENGDYKNTDQQQYYKRSYNPHPWKPSSRIPDPVPIAKSPLRIKTKDNKHNQLQPSKTASAGKITVKEENNCGNLANASYMTHKMREKCVIGCKRSPTSHLSRENSQSQILVNKDKKIKFDIKPAKLFYDVDDKANKCQSARATRNHSSSPSHRAMVDHLCALRSRNVKLQGSIQKAINIIEEKMVDVLSTKDRKTKKKTIERMEKEINNVLKMINEQSYKIIETGGDCHDKCQDGVVTQPQIDNTQVHPELSKHVVDIPHFTQPAVPNTEVYSVLVQNEERPTLDTTAIVMHIPSVKKSKTSRKRATSRLIKLQARPSTVEEEESKSTQSEENFQNIVEKVAKGVNEGVPDMLRDPVSESTEIKEEETKVSIRCLEKYPLTITDGQAYLSPILSCSTPIPSVTCQNLSHSAQKAIKKMSMKAFGKFADVVKTKTRLIINMTERIGIEDPDILPNPTITSTLPAVLAQSKLPVITKTQKALPNASDVTTTTLTPFVSVHQEPATCDVNNNADIISDPITEILSASNNETSELKNMSSDRSITSFSESECLYTWPELQRTSNTQSGDSHSAITSKMINKDCLTPFMRALGNLRKSSLFKNHHQIIPLEETSPSFTRLMDLLEGLSNINNRLNQKALKEVQLMWNPERRCSFHSSMKSSRRISYAIDTKAVSGEKSHSLVQSLTTSSSETISDKMQDNFSKNNTSTYNKEKYGDSSDTKKDTTEKFETEVTKEIREIYKLPKQNAKEVECNISEIKWRNVNLELSEIHLISIPKTQSFRKNFYEEDTLCSDEESLKRDCAIIKNRYATFLKFFYLIFYGLMYFCMAAMNFTC